MAASETGRLGSHDQPLRREVRPHGGAQPSRGHWKEAFGWNSEPGRNLGSGQGRIEELRPHDAVSDRQRLRPQENPRYVSDQTELRLPARRNHRGKVGDCRGPDWSDIVTSEQTPRGRDFGQASSGFCASRNEGGVRACEPGTRKQCRSRSLGTVEMLCRARLAGSHSPCIASLCCPP